MNRVLNVEKPQTLPPSLAHITKLPFDKWLQADDAADIAGCSFSWMRTRLALAADLGLVEVAPQIDRNKHAPKLYRRLRSKIKPQNKTDAQIKLSETMRQKWKSRSGIRLATHIKKTAGLPKRPCLKCRKPFERTHKANFICQNCSKLQVFD